MSNATPRIATAIAKVLLPNDLRDDALDDLAEGYALRVGRDGRRAASRWYRRQAIAFALRVRLATMTGGSLEPALIGNPELSGSERMTTILADIRYAARGLTRNPGFTSIAVFTLALGIGANAAIFSVVRTVMLRPLPFPEPERLVQVWEARRDRGWNEASFSHANFWDVNDMNRSFSAMGAITWGSVTLAGRDNPERLDVAYVTTGFFRALGVTPVAGRAFADGEDRVGADERIVVLSHRLWTTQYASDRRIVGQTITLGGQAYRVVGVLPEGASWLNAASVYMPLRRRTTSDRGDFRLTVLGRLAPGQTIESARADLERIAHQLSTQYPDAKGMGITIDSSERWVASASLRRALWVLMAAVGFLLLIACVNLANMLLARSTGKMRERAMRAALGASRARVVQATIADSVCLGLLGAVLGLGLAFAVVRLIRAFDPGDIPRLSEVAIDGTVLAVTFGAAILTSIVTGLAPALRTPYHDITAALREGERSVVGNRRTIGLRAALVSVEVALSLTLLVGAGLLVRSFGAILGVDRGFVTENRIMFDVTVPGPSNDADVQRFNASLVQLQSRIASLPHVKDAAAVSVGLLEGSGTGLGFGAPDKPSSPGDDVPWAGWRLITPDYFKTMGVPLLAGRDFTEQDKLGKPWRVIISKRIADELWPNQSAVGRQIILWKGQGERVAEVIGVAGNMRDWALEDRPSYSVYMPYVDGGMTPLHFVVHTTTPAGALIPAVRSIVAELSPGTPISNIRTLSEAVGDSVAARRFTMLLLVSLAMVALLLALGGVYGVLSYSVSQRRTEIGMRMALGASRSNVLRLILSQGMRPVVLGLVVGIFGAYALSKYMASLLFGVTRLDAVTYGGVAALLAVAGILACYLPARDAMRVDVLTALRDD